jgi:CTD kinase subunit alpha
MREIRLLQQLNHENILSLSDIVPGKLRLKDYLNMLAKGCVYMVSDYMDHDLTGILNNPQFTYQPEHIKCLLHQMLSGLAYLHKQGILHRDVKGSNILLNNEGQLKLADFGLARIYKINSDYTNRVITLWYRPPELLLGATVYGSEVDLWGIGCIVAEMFTKKALFCGSDELSQLFQIYKIRGSGIERSYPEVVNLPWYSLMKPKEEYQDNLRERFNFLTKKTYHLLDSLLHFNPKLRMTAEEALSSEYFQEEPLACKSNELPKPEGDWHEFESKRRDKKRREAAARGTDKESRPKSVKTQ